MKEDCYLKDSSQVLSDYTVVEKDENFKKTEYLLKVAVCKSCGYVELYVDLDKE